MLISLWVCQVEPPHPQTWYGLAGAGKGLGAPQEVGPCRSYSARLKRNVKYLNNTQTDPFEVNFAEFICFPARLQSYPWQQRAYGCKTTPLYFTSRPLFTVLLFLLLPRPRLWGQMYALHTLRNKRDFNHTVIELSRLDKTFKIIESSQVFAAYGLQSCSWYEKSQVKPTCVHCILSKGQGSSLPSSSTPPCVWIYFISYFCMPYIQVKGLLKYLCTH